MNLRLFEKLGAHKKKNRAEVYDWLRGLACIAVIIGHFRLFGIPKMYFLWSIHAFMIVTLALAANSTFDSKKILRRISYVLFVYLASVCIFAPFFKFFGKDVPVVQLLLNPLTIFIENPFFSHLWYLCLYGQILFFLFFSIKTLRKLPPGPTLFVTLLISQSMFAVTRYSLQAFESLLLPSWSFVMAFGFFIVPNLIQKIQRAHSFRWLRLSAALSMIVLCYTHPAVYPWLQTSQNSVFVLNTFVFLLILYFLSEVFFIIHKIRWFQPIIKFVLLTSRYTLIYYIYHQGISTLFQDQFLQHTAFLGLICLFTGLAYGHVLHESFLWLERKISSAIIPQSKKIELSADYRK